MGDVEAPGPAEPPVLGRTLDGYRIDQVLGAGAFSWVASGVDDNGQRRAFKVAGRLPESLPPELAAELPTQAFRTLALEWLSEGYGARPVDPLELLIEQWDRLADHPDPGLVAVEGERPSPERPWYRMEHLEGPTLRAALRSADPLPIHVFVDLARTLDRLNRFSGFKSHGDLKPENVVLTPAGPRLVDPGYVGPSGPADEHVMVTTPAYNPGLAADDREAIGIILWEAACRQHPYSPILQALLADVRIERAGFGPVSSFLWRLPDGLTPPLHARTCQEPALRTLLYRALMIPGRARVDDPVLAGLIGKAFGGIGELAEAVEQLQRTGLEYLRVCGDPGCANPGRRRCARCQALFCRQHSRPDDEGEPFLCDRCTSRMT